MTSQPSQLSQNLSPEVQAPSMNYPGQEVQKSDDNVIVQENTENIDSIDNFDDMELKETLLRGIYAFGYEKPSVIQQKAIPAVTKKRRILSHRRNRGQAKQLLFQLVCSTTSMKTWRKLRQLFWHTHVNWQLRLTL